MDEMNMRVPPHKVAAKALGGHMLWRQFLTPVDSVKPDEARRLVAEEPEVQILDVRQPAEYNQEHIPGAVLMPMAEVMDRKSELDKDKPVLVYCAIGGRSRMASQLLAGQGFSKVLNLSGGIKAWNGWTGFGNYDEGLELFDNVASVEQALDIAYGMEAALHEYYADMGATVRNAEAAKLFKKLADIETRHMHSVARRMAEITGKEPQAPGTGGSALEGGRPTQDYMDRLYLDVESPTDVVEFAMAIETQALDLYSRAAWNSQGATRDFLLEMAGEEKAHLKSLGKLMDTLHRGA
jgi:sulfur-carrier protein adenylyltransferase/sulfurtransferase